ncbi:MAG: low specificity L-threonine aldolase, partial [Oscillospiraceae bacterium]|nr:low specificity L-threonine aldolase [Oscillospiraceae bacterium]
DRASELKKALSEKGFRFYIDSPTNQIFVVMENERLASLAEKAAVSRWEPFDAGHTVVRLCTDWATTKDEVRELIGLL